MSSRARLLILLLGVVTASHDASAQDRQADAVSTFQVATSGSDGERHVGLPRLQRDTLRAPVGDPSVRKDSPARTDPRVTMDTTDGLAVDSLTVPGSPITTPVALRRLAVHLDTTPQDTVRRRPRAVQYSDGYGTRLMIHRTLSWAMLPLFAASYISGDQILKDGSDAPSWARSLHPAAATSTAVLFGANTVTGAWNLWEGRHDPNGRKRRFLHAALFMAASGGFTYAGTRLADEAEQSDAKRRQHRNVNLVSMGVSTASWLIMLVGN